jgi:hypothetical protein
MSKRIALKKDNKILIGIPTTVHKRLGVCSETIRRWVRKNKDDGYFEKNGYEIFFDVKEIKNK